MSEYGNTSAGGYTPRGRGGRGRGGFNARGRGGGGHRGGRGGNRGRGGFQQQQPHNNYNPYRNIDVDYSPEAIEQRFAPFYLPSMTQDPWQHLTQQQETKH